MFRKYPSLTNHYQEKSIHRWVTRGNPALKLAKYIVFEKLHGANMSILFQPDEETKFFSRTREIPADDSFNGFRDLFAEPIYKKMIKQFESCATNNGCNIRVFGEFFGPGIQKGVNYGDVKRFRIFDIAVDHGGSNGEEFLCPESVEQALYQLDIVNLMAPVVTRDLSLEEALDIDTRVNSYYTPDFDTELHNICEGFVIRPYHMNAMTPEGSMFVIKKKNNEFKDKQKAKAPKKSAVEIYGEEAAALHEEVLSYVNETVIQNTFSKHGKIESNKDIGKYIQLVRDDVIETFTRETEVDIDKYDKDTQRFIFNIGNNIVPLLMKEL